jgi:hypothetical protein
MNILHDMYGDITSCEQQELSGLLYRNTTYVHLQRQ